MSSHTTNAIKAHAAYLVACIPAAPFIGWAQDSSFTQALVIVPLAVAAWALSFRILGYYWDIK